MSMANLGTPQQACPQAGTGHASDVGTGVRWDIVNQVGTLLESNVPSRPLVGFKVERIPTYAQTGADMPTYVRRRTTLAHLNAGDATTSSEFPERKSLC
jgi:hypothetical protein